MNHGAQVTENRRQVTEIRGQMSEVRKFRVPAEWEKHEATWLGWPHNNEDWPGKL